MIEEKKRLLVRKKAKKLKEMEKRGILNLNAIRREIYVYQFRLASRPPWDQVLQTRGERNTVNIKDIDQHNEPLEVKG